jgi:hypothetical protein
MSRKKHIYHYIYKTTCSITGRYYIGMHSTSNLEDNYIGSGRRLWLSINKYGKENHSVEILEWLPNRSSLKLREKEIVNEDLLNDKMCMNLQLGGGGGLPSDPQSIKNIREGASFFLKNKWKDPEYRSRMLIIANNNTKQAHINGNCRYDTFLGKKHSAETKKKMSSSSIGKGLGEDNSQFGTKWITNGTENKKIKKSEDLPNGWSYGRKIK